jgi:hypothetical protein
MSTNRGSTCLNNQEPATLYDATYTPRIGVIELGPIPDKSRYRTCAVPGLQVYDYVAYERI